jgi:toxin ParE1/3/4
LRLTDAAEEDLAEIWADIARKASEAFATQFVAAIEATLEPVRYFPLAAPALEQFGSGLRVTFHNPYAIYYRPLADTLVIVRVLHGARDATAIAEQGGFLG